MFSSFIVIREKNSEVKLLYLKPFSSSQSTGYYIKTGNLRKTSDIVNKLSLCNGNINDQNKVNVHLILTID